MISEVANVKPKAWGENIAPALDTPGREGWCTLEGVPEGRNWFYDLIKEVQSGDRGDAWGYYHWKSSEVLSEEVIKQAKMNLDPLTFQQEYEASFVNFTGAAYYCYSEANVADEAYDPARPVHFCFDFNVSPGIAVVIQQFPLGDFVIDEVHIPRNSNTTMVCDRLITKYHNHTGTVFLYGDASGEQRRSSGIVGTDWHIIKNMLTKGIPGSEIVPRIPPANPRERARVNAVNSRLKDGTDARHLFIAPRCKHTIKDFEGVSINEKDGSIDKSDITVGHISDAIGYFIHRHYPVNSFDISSMVTDARIIIGPSRG